MSVQNDKSEPLLMQDEDIELETTSMNNEQDEKPQLAGQDKKQSATTSINNEQDEEIQLPKTSHTVVMIYFAKKDLPDVNFSIGDTFAIFTIEVIVGFCAIFALFFLMLNGTASDVVYDANSYSSSWDTTRFRSFNIYYNTSTLYNTTINGTLNSSAIEVEKQTYIEDAFGEFDMRVNDYDGSYRAHFILVLVRMCAVFYLLVNIDSSFFQYIYDLCHIFLYLKEGVNLGAASAKSAVILLTTFELIICFFAVGASLFQVLIATSVFDVFANVLAITFILELDDWAYTVITRGLKHISDSDFVFKVNKSKKLNTKRDCTMWMFKLSQLASTHAAFYVISMIWIGITQYYHAVKDSGVAYIFILLFIIVLELGVFIHAVFIMDALLLKYI